MKIGRFKENINLEGRKGICEGKGYDRDKEANLEGQGKKKIIEDGEHDIWKGNKLERGSVKENCRSVIGKWLPQGESCNKMCKSTVDN